MNPRLAFAALILNSHTDELVGHATIWTDVHPLPSDGAQVKRIAREITKRAHADGDLPTGQYYSVIAWSQTGGAS